MTESWPFGTLTPLSFDLIMADPPWRFRNWSAKGERKNPVAHYDCLNLDDIARLPVGQLARGDSLLFLWATWPMLREAVAAMESWGFRYVSGGAWHKKTSNGLSSFGTGYRVRSASEPWLLGTVGNPKTSRSHRNIIEGIAREHSRKPEEAYRWCESYMPDSRRADLFSRESRAGWESWGFEAGKFDQDSMG